MPCLRNFPSNSVLKNGKEKVISRLCLTTEAHASFRAELSTFNWNSLCDINDAITCYNEFMHKFTCIYDSHFPIETIKIKSIDQRKLYIDSGIKKLLIEKKKLYKKY